MNIPAYQQKDYSYLQNAFTGLGQAANQFQQSLAKTQEIGAREQELEREKEFFKKLNLTREDQENVRDIAIVEFASEIREAMGLPNTKEGLERARDIAMQHYYPITAQEWKDGSAMERLNKQSAERQKLLTKFGMDNWRKKALSQQETPQLPPLQAPQAPLGDVGVEDRGTVNRNLSAFPQSQGEAQMSAGRTLETQPRFQPTVTPDVDRQKLWREGVGAGLSEEPEFQSTLGTLGRQAVVGKERSGPLYKETYAEEMAAEPIESGSQFYKDFPSSEKEKDREVEKLKAQQKASTGTTDEQNKNIRNYTKRYDDIKAESLKAQEKITRLRQARVKLNSGKKPDERMMALLEGENITNPTNPSIEEIDRKINEYQRSSQSLNEDLTETKDIISKLGRGMPLTDIIKELDAEKQEMVNKAMKFIESDIVPVSSQITSTAQILNKLPDSYRKVMSRRIQMLRDRGALDKDIVDALLGRRKRGL